MASNQSYAEVDTESWNSIGFGKKLPHSFKLDFEQSLRLKDNISSFKQTFTEGSISFNIFNGMKVFIPVRYAVFKNKTKKDLVLEYPINIILKESFLGIDQNFRKLIKVIKSLIL